MMEHVIEWLEFLLLMLFVSGVSWVGYFETRWRPVRYIIMGLMGLIGFISTAMGGLVLLSHQMVAQHVVQIPVPPHFESYGHLFMVFGLCPLFSLVPWVRIQLSQRVFKGLNPDSVVHTWSLFIFLGCLTANAMLITQLYDPAIYVKSLHNVPVYLSALVSCSGFVAFTTLAIGIWHQPIAKIRDLLGLQSLSPRQISMMAAFGVILAGVMMMVDSQWGQWVDPKTLKIMESISQAIHPPEGVLNTVLASTVLGFSAGLGEELLFRGLVQPVFGWVATAILFALVHVHYGPTPLILELVVLGLIFGYCRMRFSTTAAIVVHCMYDFTVMMSTLFSP